MSDLMLFARYGAQVEYSRTVTDLDVFSLSLVSQDPIPVNNPPHFVCGLMATLPQHVASRFPGPRCIPPQCIDLFVVSQCM